MFVGDEVTTLVGCGVGGEVGRCEGAEVGPGVGFAVVGTGVGFKVVGAGVGKRDGSGVNTCVMVKATAFISTT